MPLVGRGQGPLVQRNNSNTKNNNYRRHSATECSKLPFPLSEFAARSSSDLNGGAKRRAQPGIGMCGRCSAMHHHVASEGVNLAAWNAA